MPRYTFDEMTRVCWAVVADKDFPALSELAAGVDLECLLTGDGLNIQTTENTVDDFALCEAYDAALPGTYSVNPELTLRRHNNEGGDVDLAWDTFSTRGESGALVVRLGINSNTAFAAGQKVMVYPTRVGQRRPAASARNTNVSFMVTFFGSEAPALDAVIVAS